MKSLILAIVLVCRCAFAGNIAVAFWADRANPEGVPGYWFAETKDVGDSTDVPEGFSSVMTPQEFADYKASHESDFYAWRAMKIFRSKAPELISAEAERRVELLTGDTPTKINKVALFCSMLDKRLTAIEQSLGITNTLTAAESSATQALRAMWAAVAGIRSLEAALNAKAATNATPFDWIASFAQ